MSSDPFDCPWALKKVRIYVPGPDGAQGGSAGGIIGAREFDVTSGTTGTEKPIVYHYDHLGSITATTTYGQSAYATDGNGKPGKFSEDAWGQRRNPTTWSGAPDPASTDDGGANSVTPRGFTGHEMLDDLGLVHMNGRIYDPLLGRFLSADIMVQAPGNLQSYNRYSYVFNNPLSFTDPSGFETEQEKNARQKAEEAWAGGTRHIVGGAIQPDFENSQKVDKKVTTVSTATAVQAHIQKQAEQKKLAAGTKVMVPILKNGVKIDQVIGTVQEAASLATSAGAASAAPTQAGYTWKQFCYDFDDGIGLHGFTHPDNPAHTIFAGFWFGLRTIGATAELAMDSMGMTPAEQQGLGLALGLPETMAGPSFVSFVGNTGPETIGAQQIAFGSDMSSWAQTLRYTTKNWNPGGNVAVFEYLDAGGNFQYSMGYAQRMVNHAEQVVGNSLIAQGINPLRVTRIYTEFAPCTGPRNCAKYVREMFPNADVLFSFPHNAAGRAAKSAIFLTYP